MYGTLYTSSEYYDYNQYNPVIIYNNNKENNNNNKENNECIICWLPSIENTPVKCMKEHIFFVSKCGCNTFFHDTCLIKWLETKSTCPICCRKISIKNDKYTSLFIKVKIHANICYKNTCKILQIVSFFSMLNFIFLLFYFIFFEFRVDKRIDDYKEYL